MFILLNIISLYFLRTVKLLKIFEKYKNDTIRDGESEEKIERWKDKGNHSLSYSLA